MVSDGINLGSRVAVIGEELKDQVLEFLAETATIHFLEVGVRLPLQDQIVEVLLFAGLLEGENALNDDEKDDSNGEHVDICAFVLLALLDFGSHVCHGATVGLESIDVLVASEAEVGQLEVQIVVDENVLEFEVAMHDSTSVNVLDGIEHLVKEESACIFAHCAHSLAQVEEKTALDELHDNVNKVLNDAARWLHNLASVAIFVHLYDSLVLQILQDGDLVVNRKN